MQQFIQALKREIKSEVLTDHISKVLYANDASMYQIEPLCVVIPRTKNDLIRTIELASEYSMPIIARGAATSTTGGALGKGVIIDTSKHLDKVVEINYREGYIVVQPGIVLDRINEILEPHGYMIGPDVSTSNRCTIGGMVANNTSGAYSLKYGQISDHVLQIEAIVHTGEVLSFSPLTKNEYREKLKQKGTEGSIYRNIERIARYYKETIDKEFPAIKRRVSGYNLNKIHDQNLAALFCGSEGTLGFISEITLKLSPLRKKETIAFMRFHDLLEALEMLPTILLHNPIALELVDNMIFPEENHVASLIASFEDEADARKLQAANVEIITDPAEQKKLWDIRKEGLSKLMSKRGYTKPLGFIEDTAVDVETLPEYIEKMQAIFKKHDKSVSFFGHAGQGCLHIRPFFNTKSTQDFADCQKMMDEVIELVQHFNGALSSEHGDGLVRSWANKQYFSPKIYEALQKVKHAFDPYNLMNPGKIVSFPNAPTQPLLENLKLSPFISTQKIDTFYDFSKEGGLALAVDMCNGNGLCRKKSGTMCPSYQVTQDEKDSTRARAHLLQDIVHGKLGEKEIFDPKFLEVMDLCVQCKGCKSECPSQVDMAKLKQEFLYHYHRRKKHSFRDFAFAHIGSILDWIFPFSPLLRFIQKRSIFQKVLEKQNITTDHQLPELAPKRFSSLYKKSMPHKKRVVLFIDTFTEFFHPELGLFAIDLLEAIGYSVEVPSWQCCGRTLLSKGYLPAAKKKMQLLIDSLDPFAKKGLSIIGLEPSCLLTLTDEAEALHIDREKVQRIAEKCTLLDEFLFEHKESLRQKIEPISKKIKIHGHCHQKALSTMTKQVELLKYLSNEIVEEIPSGCCGMAGSFGYEKEHASIAKKMGELVLFKEVEKAQDAYILADGFSCRSHIQNETAKKPLHLIQLLHKKLKSSAG